MVNISMKANNGFKSILIFAQELILFCRIPD